MGLYDLSAKLPGGGAQSLADYRGKVLLPLYKTVVDGLFDVNGNRLTLKGCLGPVCRSQSWTRVE